MSFRNRWRIEGTLTTLEPIHIGDGDLLDPEDAKKRKMPDLVESGGKKRPVQVATVATFPCNGAHRPFLPGSALKGVLRSWITSGPSAQRRQLEQVFGSEDPKKKDSVGGKAEFWNALAERHEPDLLRHVPYPDPDRWTGVVASVGIDRRTRTASPNKLFYQEFVPPGASFKAVIVGQDMDEAEIDLLLLALEGFNHDTDPIRIGAETHNGRGRMTWELTSIHRLEGEQAVDAWLSDSASPAGFERLPHLDKSEERTRRDNAVTARQAIASARAILSLDLELQFEGPFLVNEPYRTKPENAPESDTRANHAPRLDHRGVAVLPSRSIRGAFRSQAEKILRTLTADALGDPHRAGQGCDAIEDVAEVRKLSVAAQVFGAPGWRALIEFSDFTAAREASMTRRQEFVAIDRFTGGSAHRLKFNADHVECPCLKGTVRIDLDRVEPWALGLLALTLRDLIEGDISLGFGASKGYGVCRATITSISRPTGFGRCRKWADDWGLGAMDWNCPLISLLDTDEVQSALEIALGEFRSHLGLN